MTNRKHSTFQIQLLVGFLLVIGVFSTLSVNIFTNNEAQLQTSILVRHTNEVLLETEGLLDNIYEAESSQRGFIITGESIFQELYRTAIDSISYHFTNLQQLTLDNPSQQMNLQKLQLLINGHSKNIEDNIKLRERNGFEFNTQRLLTLRSNALLKNINTVLRVIQNVENDLLIKRTHENEKQIANFNKMFFISVAIVGILIVGLFYMIYYNLSQRNKSNQGLIKYKSELEQIVKSRTVELLNTNETLTQKSELLNEMGKLAKVGGWELNLLDMTIIWTDEVYYIHELDLGKKPSLAEAIYFYAPEARPIIQNAIDSAISKGGGWDLELPLITSKGNRLWVRAIGHVQFSQGKATRVHGTFQDITMQKRIQDEIKTLNESLELKVKERTAQLENTNSELEFFSYSVSHDLRAPLRSINGYANALVEDYAARLDEEGLRLLGVIVNNAKRMGQLIDDLLMFSRLGRQPVFKSDLNLDEFVQQIKCELIHEEGNGREIDINILPMGSVHADASMLRQVWINLLSNALKYSHKKKKSVIEVGSTHSIGSEKTFYVKDNGAGFDMAYSNKLFGVFQRLHKAKDFEGTGVGLALTKRIIDKHGGRIWANSELDVGAIFYFTLPD